MAGPLPGEQRLVHFDLKGCPLRISYFTKVIRQIKEWGATGVLIEWEDTFPYERSLSDIGSLHSSKSAYTIKEISAILSCCSECDLEVIPLVQTFGHLEFVLKWSKWKHLREVPKYVSSLCPSHPESLSLIKELIIQMLRLHKDAKFIHIGGDEVWHLGLCGRCEGKDRSRLYLSHVMSVLKFLRECYPAVQPIMWDDMLRTVDKEKLIEYEIGLYVEPMVWNYHSGRNFPFPSDMWSKYSKVFGNLWIASAYKGATGSCQILPIAEHHIGNHEKWLETVNEIRPHFTTIRGIAMTGWSRYDHYAVLCELFPAGLTSLALCLRVWITGKYSEHVLNDVSNMLGYNEECPLLLNPYMYSKNYPVPKTLTFAGHEIFEAILDFINSRSKFNSVCYSDYAFTWFNTWHVKRNNTSIMQVERILQGFQNLYSELVVAEQRLRKTLTEAFYQETIDDWLGSYVNPLLEKLSELIKDAENQLQHQ